jgi:hypothetical protein
MLQQPGSDAGQQQQPVVLHQQQPVQLVWPPQQPQSPPQAYCGELGQARQQLATEQLLCEAAVEAFSAAAGEAASLRQQLGAAHEQRAAADALAAAMADKWQAAAAALQAAQAHEVQLEQRARQLADLVVCEEGWG